MAIVPLGAGGVSGSGVDLTGALYNVRVFGGARGDGVTDDTAAITTAVGFASIVGGIVYFPPGVYLITRLLFTGISNVRFVFAPGASIKSNTTGVTQQAMFDIRGTVSTATTLSSIASLGGTALTVVSNSGVVAGDFIEIESAAAISGQAPYFYEQNEVLNVAGGTTINLRYPLRNTYDTGVATVSVRKIIPLTGIEIYGGLFVGPSTGTDGDCVRLQHCRNPIVSGSQFTNFPDRGLIFYRCQHGTIENCEAYGGTDATNSWGITLHSCEGIRLANNVVRDHPWDGFDLSYGSMYNTYESCRAYNCGDFGFLCGHGLHGHHNVYKSCIVVGTGAGGFACGDPSFDGDDDNTFIGCEVIGTNNPFMVRKNSARNRFKGCKSMASGGSAFIVQDTATETELHGCYASAATTFGFSFQSSGPSRAFGGHVENSGSTGVRISACPECLVSGTKVTGSVASHNIAVLAASHKTRIVNVQVSGAGGANNGVHVNASTDVLVINPVAQNNGAYGVRIFESAGGDSARSRIIGGYFSGNGTAPTISNNSAESAISGATPSIAGNDQFVITQGGGTTVTNFTDPVDGQLITIRAGDGNTTVQNNGGMSLQGGANFAMGSGAILSLKRLNGVWQEVGRRTP